MCGSPKRARVAPTPILPPAAEPAEFLNEELQQNAASRKILGIRRLQSGFQTGPQGGSAGGARGGLPTIGALSQARTMTSSRSTIRSVEQGITQHVSLGPTAAEQQRQQTHGIPSLTSPAGTVHGSPQTRMTGRGGAVRQTTRATTGTRVTSRDGTTTFRAS